MASRTIYKDRLSKKQPLISPPMSSVLAHPNEKVSVLGAFDFYKRESILPLVKSIIAEKTQTEECDFVGLDVVWDYDSRICSVHHRTRFIRIVYLCSIESNEQGNDIRKVVEAV